MIFQAFNRAITRIFETMTNNLKWRLLLDLHFENLMFLEVAETRGMIAIIIFIIFISLQSHTLFVEIWNILDMLSLFTGLLRLLTILERWVGSFDFYTHLRVMIFCVKMSWGILSSIRILLLDCGGRLMLFGLWVHFMDGRR